MSLCLINGPELPWQSVAGISSRYSIIPSSNCAGRQWTLLSNFYHSCNVKDDGPVYCIFRVEQFLSMFLLWWSHGTTSGVGTSSIFLVRKLTWNGFRNAVIEYFVPSWMMNWIFLFWYFIALLLTYVTSIIVLMGMNSICKPCILSCDDFHHTTMQASTFDLTCFWHLCL